jgi:hypothetical protein
MAENLSLNLDTIIKLRHDVKEAWENELIEDAGANFVLAEGEVGICVDKKEAALDDTFTIEADDKVMFKVGDGKTTFKDLPWIYAKASDVADWAKAETKPTYSADEVGAYSKTEIDSMLTTKLAEKVTIVEGKGLSEEDFTEAEKTKLAGIETGAQVNVQANWSESNSDSASYIQNKPNFEGLSANVSKNAKKGSKALDYWENYGDRVNKSLATMGVGKNIPMLPTAIQSRQTSKVNTDDREDIDWFKTNYARDWEAGFIPRGKDDEPIMKAYREWKEERKRPSIREVM